MRDSRVPEPSQRAAEQKARRDGCELVEDVEHHKQLAGADEPGLREDARVEVRDGEVDKDGAGGEEEAGYDDVLVELEGG